MCIRDSTYTEDKDLVARAKALKAQHKEACSLLYKPDLLWKDVYKRQP